MRLNIPILAVGACLGLGVWSCGSASDRSPETTGGAGSSGTSSGGGGGSGGGGSGGAGAGMSDSGTGASGGAPVTGSGGSGGGSETSGTGAGQAGSAGAAQAGAGGEGGAGGTAECAEPDSGLIAWWPADGDADDAVGDLDGVFPGTYSDGAVDEAFSITHDDYMTVPDAPTLNPEQISVAVWLKRDVTSGGADPVLKKAGDSSSENGGYAMEFGGFNGSSPDQLFFYVYTGGPETGVGSPGWQSSPGATIANGSWVHAVGTYDGSHVGLYINGELIGLADAAGPIVASPNPLQIGRAPASEGARAFTGLIDEVSLYDRALSASSVRALYETGPVWKCE